MGGCWQNGKALCSQGHEKDYDSPELSLNYEGKLLLVTSWTNRINLHVAGVILEVFTSPRFELHFFEM